MIDFELMMQDELDDFYDESEKHNDLKMYVEFDNLCTEYKNKEIKFDKPKMKSITRDYYVLLQIRPHSRRVLQEPP